MMENKKYKSEKGILYEFRDSVWYRDNVAFSPAVFLSSASAAMQYELLHKKYITQEEFFEENDDSKKGYIFYISQKSGKIKPSNKLTEIIDNSIGLAD
jgi:hypothetical protein